MVIIGRVRVVLSCYLLVALVLRGDSQARAKEHNQPTHPPATAHPNERR